jgi:hypothetical protein
VRAFARARDIPPKDVGAYGIVAITSLPTPASRERLSRFCTAFIAHLPSQASSVFPRGQQMVTVWPLDDPDAEPAKNNDCGFALDHYDLQAGISAVRDARTQGAGLDGRGPFLLGWSPSVTRGVPDKFVLVVDMSTFEIERLRLSIHDFVDHYGSDILNAVRLFAGKS